MIRSAIHSLLCLVWNERPVRSVGLTLVYAAVCSLSLWLAYQLRFDFQVPETLLDGNLLAVCASAVCIKLLCLFAFHQFDGLLSFFNTPDIKRLLGACASGSAFLGVLWAVFGIDVAPPRGVLINDFMFSIMMLCATRIGFRHLRVRVFHGRPQPAHRRRRVGIIGAGDTGAALAMDLLDKPWLGLRPVAFFDDHRDTLCSIHGIPLVGRPERIAEIRGRFKIEEIIIAMPSAPAKRVGELLRLTQEVGLPCRTVPSLDQLATGRVGISKLRPLEIHDLLGRAPVEIETGDVRNLIKGRTVMVTGAGGSIGSELCRQIASFEPSALLLVERAEPQLFVIEQELRNAPAGVAIVPVVGDITHRGRMREIFRQFRPHLVFHAAAHKHVPMMERQPEEAVRNNILGTAQLAELAIAHAVERFVFISTDKAVNPTSAMGASKRFAELYLQSLHTRKHQTKFMAVRFGNVLGSSGSVVPTFARQIAAGGPVTVTHPEMTRFFMTIPEAVSLVLQSSVFGKGGDIFVLDMGKPVKIVDLATQMIALSGLKPYEDIDIVFSGLRPGEKLYEELSHCRENLTATAHFKIMRLVSPPQHFSIIRSFFDELVSALDRDDMGPVELKALLATAIPEYTPFIPHDAVAAVTAQNSEKRDWRDKQLIDQATGVELTPGTI